MIIFISYASVNKSTVDNWIVSNLRISEHEVWIDHDELRGGTNWKIELDTAIRNCDALVYAMTNDANASDTCQWELETAIRYGKSIIPVLMDVGISTPKLLNEIHYIDFSSGATGEAVAKLISSLKKLEEKQTLAQTVPPVPPPEKPIQSIGDQIKSWLLVARRGIQKLNTEIDHRFKPPLFLVAMIPLIAFFKAAYNFSRLNPSWGNPNFGIFPLLMGIIASVMILFVTLQAFTLSGNISPRYGTRYLLFGVLLTIIAMLGFIRWTQYSSINPENISHLETCMSVFELPEPTRQLAIETHNHMIFFSVAVFPILILLYENELLGQFSFLSGLALGWLTVLFLPVFLASDTAFVGLYANQQINVQWHSNVIIGEGNSFYSTNLDLSRTSFTLMGIYTIIPFVKAWRNSKRRLITFLRLSFPYVPYLLTPIAMRIFLDLELNKFIASQGQCTDNELTLFYEWIYFSVMILIFLNVLFDAINHRFHRIEIAPK